MKEYVVALRGLASKCTFHYVLQSQNGELPERLVLRNNEIFFFSDNNKEYHHFQHAKIPTLEYNYAGTTTWISDMGEP